MRLQKLRSRIRIIIRIVRSIVNGLAVNKIGCINVIDIQFLRDRIGRILLGIGE